jgi:hypothetical protein
MKERPILMKAPMVRATLDGTKTQTRWIAKEFNGLDVDAILKRFPNQNGCPHGESGDRLWVREAFGFNPDHPGILAHCCYRADVGHEYDGIKWKPSIHMPRAASRILLEIVSVRVERLNDISESDAFAEGIRQRHGD